MKKSTLLHELVGTEGFCLIHATLHTQNGGPMRQVYFRLWPMIDQKKKKKREKERQRKKKQREREKQRKTNRKDKQKRTNTRE